MSARAFEPPWVLTPDGIHRAQNVAYGLYVNLDDGLPTANPHALHRADFCLEFNGRKVEMSWDQVLAKFGFKQ